MYTYLDIVKEFSCEMCGKCCRRDWLITLDEDSYQRNANLFAQAGQEDEFHQAFVPIAEGSSPGEYAYIAKQANGSCWFLEERNLCRLHRIFGHTHLDSVCQLYPRYPIATGRGLEITLSFSCPAALKLASRVQPLNIIRSDSPPIAVGEGCTVAHVYPRQQPVNHPLRYYFELEGHFIDIIQCRDISVENRLQMIHDTIRLILGLNREYDDTGVALNRIVRRNYDLLDNAKSLQCQDGQGAMTEILLENFFVNFIFKKIFYQYGLNRGTNLLALFWRRIANIKEKRQDQAAELEEIRLAIMEWELQYGHNRKALWSG